MTSDGRRRRGLPRWLRRGVTALPAAALSRKRHQPRRLGHQDEQRRSGPERWTPPAADAAARLLRESGLFDHDWYRAQVDEALPTPDDGVRHYLAHGCAAGLSPHPAFLGAWYITQVLTDPGYGSRPRIRAAPLLHYLTVGARRGISPHPAFDAATYLEDHPDAERDSFGPLAHFLRGGGEAAEVPLDMPRGMPAGGTPQRRTAEEFLRDSREIGVRLRDRVSTEVTWESARSGVRDPDLLSVVLVATKGSAATCVTVDRALASASSRIEVVVVNAGLDDGESARLLLAMQPLRRTHVHRTEGATTLEVARNVGATLSRGDVLLFLPEHAWCLQGWDVPLLDALRTHAAVQPVVLNNGGAVWSAGLHFLANGSSLSLHYDMSGDAAEVSDVRAVDAVTSSCVAVPADRFLEVAGFDTSFVDDVSGGELSLRMADAAGRAVACVGASAVGLWSPDDAGAQLEPRTVQRVENDALQRSLWRGRTSRLASRLAEDGLDLVGLLSPGPHGDFCTPLLVRDRAARPLRWAIKIGAPNVVRRESWGDWHFAVALRDSLERLGHQVSIDCRQEWYRSTAHLDDVTVVLRGLYVYELNPAHTNLIWVISHPDLVSERELDGFDLVFGASARWCGRMSRGRERPAELLMQCTDQRRFHPGIADPARRHTLLAVANARADRPRAARAAVAAALEAGLTPAVYGLRWDGLLPEGAWKGSHLPNDELPGMYAAAGAVLNDHWDDMREEGLISNRLFDLAACDARAISDYLPEIADVFGDVVLTYQRPDELPALLAQHLAETPERRRAREELGARVRREHTFDARARVLSARVESLRAEAPTAF